MMNPRASLDWRNRLTGCVLLFAISVCPITSSIADRAEHYRVVAVFPHDASAFTQGLVYHAGEFVEGTGLRGRSELRQVQPDTGVVKRRQTLAPQLFGEGVTVLDKRIYQLTWTAGLAFVYDLKSLEVLRTFNYRGEGWGLTHDGELLIMSDGTDELRFIEPSSFEQVRRVLVRDENGPVRMLNELEFIDGKIFANVYQTDTIVVIDPATGRVSRQLDFRAVSEAERLINRHALQLNGIAFDGEQDRIFITGKHWSRIYQIELEQVDL